MKGLLINHLQSLCHLSVQQWDFTQGKSTIGALLAATDHWHNLLDSGLEICAIFFDYSKAFDTVPPQVLAVEIRKQQYPSTYSEMDCFMGGVSTSVWGAPCQICKLHVLSGVPKGSVLGPFCLSSISMT